MRTKQKVNIALPDVWHTEIEIEGNKVERLLFPSKYIEVYLNTTNDAGVLIATPIEQIYSDHVLLVKGNRFDLSAYPELPVLKVKRTIDFNSISSSTPLIWLRSPASFVQNISPLALANSWINKFSFKEENRGLKIDGLRKPQVGALHAISAEFSKNKVEPCTVVLPTGTGKTETMLSTIIYHRCPRVLVLVPSNSLRDQVGDKFKTLGCLKELGVIDEGTLYPAVTKIKKGIRTSDDAARILENSNVIIATPQILNSKFSSQGVLDALCEGCDYLFVDEAHHISARKWNEIKEKFIGKRVLQFTATPFRNDTESLGAKIIYNYTMGDAQKAGYFTSVQLEPVEEYFQEQMDESIAQKALALLNKDIEDGLDHLMMARVRTKSRAEDVFKIYKRLVPQLNPILVHSDMSKTEQKRRLRLLADKTSKLVVCVDMLGEGYDLPNLKVAAIHDHHKSLAITLQFIGRFTRVSNKETLGVAKVVVNIADPGVEGALQKLYALGADWDVVLRRLSENQIDREVRLQEVVDSLKAEGDLHDQLSLWNLRPSCSAMLFKTDCDAWKPEKFKDLNFSCDEYWHSISEEEHILVIVAVKSTAVKWGHFKELNDINYKILIAHWDGARGALFVNSNDYKRFQVEKLVGKICGESSCMMSGKQIFNVLNNIEYPLVTNLGSAQNGAISFTQFFGPNVTEGLSAVEKSTSTLSNIAALGYENGDKVLWGCSERKGKVWSPQTGTIADWLNWVKDAWDKVANGGNDETNITRDFLRPKKISEPHSFKPVSIQWGEQLQQRFEEGVRVYFGDACQYLYEIDLKVDWNESNNNPLLVVQSELYRSVYELVINGELPKGYEYKLIEGEEIRIQTGNSEETPLMEEMLKDPIFVYYADGSFSYNCYWVEVKNNIGVFEADSLNPMKWDVNITNESMGVSQKRDSVQFQTWQEIEGEFDIIINDDGSGEAADLIALKSFPDKIVLSLYHCKYSHGESPGRRLNDLYEVCGQAQRSVRWKHVGLPYVYKHIKNRESAWQSRGATRFLKGSIAALENLKNRSRTTPLEFHVTIVQPGVLKSVVTEEMLKLLGTSELFIRKTTLADLQVWCSG
ncbi:DEAD/DEAH box helicase [Alteromonadaceae bacterium M269]|nr:DEAD/DEAH box helicase [Alteromonadaceae bacterium M269]